MTEPTAPTPRDDYPRIIRQHLQAARAHGRQFHPAWTDAMTEHPPQDYGWGVWPPVKGHECAELLAFLHDHMQAGYNRSESRRGRFRAPPPEASSAVTTREGSSPVRNQAGLCVSGDGCSATATHGRFGAMFCEVHGRELARMDFPIPAGPVRRNYTARVTA